MNEDSPLPKEFLLEMHRRMLRIRGFDEQASRMVRRGLIPGTVHASIGQEAQVVGACMALDENDYMTGNHRSHGHPIGKGSPLGPLMAELLGLGLSPGLRRLLTSPARSIPRRRRRSPSSTTAPCP